MTAWYPQRTNTLETTLHYSRTKVLYTYFEETSINLLKWPPKRPDMSLIENVRAEMVRMLWEQPTARNV